MLKWLAAAMVIAAMGGIGVALSHSLYRRKKELEQIRFGLQLLETEIVYSQRPLAYALENCGARLWGEIAVIFRNSARSLQSGGGESGEAALLAAIAEREPHLAINREERDILRRIAAEIGFSDAEDQKTKLRFFQRQIDQALALAVEDGEKWRKIYSAGGWILGLLLVLILI